jgi:uncharacterized protein with PIN domain
VTYYETRRGVVVSSRPESEWDDQSQAEMLALAAYRKTRCPNCGGDLGETTAAENEDRYLHEPPLQCFRCVGLARSAEAWKDRDHAHTYLHLVKLKRG